MTDNCSHLRQGKWFCSAAIAIFLLIFASICSSCGYHAAGKADLLPKKFYTIAIPANAFPNLSANYRIGDALSAAIGREFIARTRYRITSDTNDSDAILSGSVLRLEVSPTTNAKIGEDTVLTSATITLVVQCTLRDTHSKAVLYHNAGLQVRGAYEVSTSASAFFDESGLASDRISRTVAQTIVTSILEQF